MANVTKQIRLTEKGNTSGPNYDIFYSLDCVNYLYATGGINAYLPFPNSYVTVEYPSASACIKLVDKSPLCNSGSVIVVVGTTSTTTTTSTTSTTTTCAPCCTGSITSITDAGGGNINIAFQTGSCGGCIATTIQSSPDNITWGGNNTAGCSSPRTITAPTGSTYYRIIIVCATGCESAPSDSVLYVSGSTTTTTTTSTTTTTTSTTSTTTTTTTEAPTYDYYVADEYDCNGCTLSTPGVLVAFPTGTSVTINKFYRRFDDQPFVYQIIESTGPGSPAVILKTPQYNTCTLACEAYTTTTTSTTSTSTTSTTTTTTAAPTTTTTSTTTTTTAAPCECYTVENTDSVDISVSFYDCGGSTINPECNVVAVASTIYLCIQGGRANEFTASIGTNCSGGTPSFVKTALGTNCNDAGDCINPTTTTTSTTTTTTTTTAAPTTTTTTAATTTTTTAAYDYYEADEYSCDGCTLQQTNVCVGFPAGDAVVLTNRYYHPATPTGFVYKNFTLLGSPCTPAILMTTVGNSVNCGTACGYVFYTATQYLNCVQNSSVGQYILRVPNSLDSGTWWCGDDGYQYEFAANTSNQTYDVTAISNASPSSCGNLGC